MNRAAFPVCAGTIAVRRSNFVISLKPISAEYRTAQGVDYVPKLVEALSWGSIISCAMSAVLLRSSHAIPGRNQVQKSLLLSLFAFIFVPPGIEVPETLLNPVNDSWRSFPVGGLFNISRIAAPGVTIGLVQEQLKRSGR